MTDHSTFIGSEAEMRMLVDFSAAYLQAMEEHGNTVRERAVEGALAVTGGNTLLLSLGVGMFEGAARRPILSTLYLAALGHRNEAMLASAARMRLPDIQAALELAAETGATLEDTLALA
jgi:hypothetical protein